MTGVEILAVEEVVTKTAFGWEAFCICFGLILLAGVGLGLCVSCSRWGFKWDDFYWVVFCALLIGALLGAVAGRFAETPSETETQYKVLISDEVSTNEFLERYEIVDQEGKIYTVRERGVEDGN